LCVGQPNVPECAVGYHFFVFMQQKFFYHSVVCFCLFTMNANGPAVGFSKRNPT